MNTIEEAREHCRFVGEGIERDIAEGKAPVDIFEGTQLLRFKVERDDDDEKVVGGELGGDDSHVVVSESGVTKRWGDEIVGYAFGEETRAALVEFFSMYYHA